MGVEHFFKKYFANKIRILLTKIFLDRRQLHVQGPSLPRLLGRSDFSLQEN